VERDRVVESVPARVVSNRGARPFEGDTAFRLARLTEPGP